MIDEYGYGVLVDTKMIGETQDVKERKPVDLSLCLRQIPQGLTLY
jgi:hypothetical protein